MSEQKVRVIDCFIFRRDKVRGLEWLVLKRAEGRQYEGMWRMVAGKIDDGETAWQTALREVKEELGIEPVALWTVPFINQYYEWKEDRVNTIPVFVAEIKHDSDIKLNDEHHAYRWVNINDAARKLEFPAQRSGIQNAYHMINSQPELADILKIDEKEIRQFYKSRKE